jgi:hypothetical protein
MKMSRKLTAVEWLYNELNYHIKVEWPMNKSIRNKFEQAKAMEKEQITDSYIMGSYDMAAKEFKPEQYYNETYES